MNSSDEIERRVRALSPDKRALLVKRSLAKGVVTADVEPAGQQRVTLFFTVRGSADATPTHNPDKFRDYLTQRLPAHMIPASFRVLDAMPLLPNGKVDIAALNQLKDEITDTRDAWAEPRNATEQILAEIWCKVLQMDEVSIHDNFFELGGDSILSIHVVSRANQQGLKLSPNDIFNFPTIAQLGERAGSGNGSQPVNSATDTDKSRPLPREPSAEMSDPSSSRLDPKNVLRPFFLVHGGERIVRQIRSLLGQNLPLYLLTSHWDSADLSARATVEQLADENLNELRSLQSTGPYYLGGYSMGAPIALEMAHRLQSSGEHVEMLFILDPPGRVEQTSGPAAVVVDGTAGVSETAGTQSRVQRVVARHLARLEGLSAVDKIRYLIEEAWQQSRYRIISPLSIFLRAKVILPGKTNIAAIYRSCGLDVPTSLKENYVSAVYTYAWSRYELKPFSGPMVLFRGSDTRFSADRETWEGIARGELEVEWFQGGHLDFTNNPELMKQWSSRLVELLMERQTRQDTGDLEMSADKQTSTESL